ADGPRCAFPWRITTKQWKEQEVHQRMEFISRRNDSGLDPKIRSSGLVALGLVIHPKVRPVTHTEALRCTLLTPRSTKLSFPSLKSARSSARPAPGWTSCAKKRPDLPQTHQVQ